MSTISRLGITFPADIFIESIEVGSWSLIFCFTPFLNLLQIEPGACGLILTGNVVMFLTIFGFFVAFDGDDFEYSNWGIGY